jgi:peptidoglycan-N-acetylglucosamine deacetylase
MRLALTFDAEHADKPAEQEWIWEILGVLQDHEARATFFLQGQWAAAYPGSAQEIASLGHPLGNHSHHHTPLEWLTRDGFLSDLATAEQTIKEVTGKEPVPWYRPPFGKMAQRHDAWLREYQRIPVLWNIGSQDWHPDSTADQVFADVTENVEDGHIVLLHTWSRSTAEALPRILDKLDAEYVTLEELL